MRLATFNLMHGRSLHDGRVDAARLQAAVAALDVDVLALQEADRGQPRSAGADHTADAARALGASHHRFAAALVGTPGETYRMAGDADDTSTDPLYGVGLISRWPVAEWLVLRLPAAPARAPVMVPRAGVVLLADEPRVVLAAVVDSPVGRLTVASTHLSFVPGWNVAQLRRTMRWLAGLPGPRFLLGDLNLPMSLLAPLAAGPAGGRWPGWRPTRPPGHGCSSTTCCSTPAVPRGRSRPAHRRWMSPTTAPSWSASRPDRLSRCDRSLAPPSPPLPPRSSPPWPAAAHASATAAPTPVCVIDDPRAIELSGLVATRTGFVAINDSQFESEKMQIIFLDAECKVTSTLAYPTPARDPEDLAVAPDGTLWVADTGDNVTAETHRQTVALWMIPSDGSPPVIHRLTYPDGPARRGGAALRGRRHAGHHHQGDQRRGRPLPADRPAAVTHHDRCAAEARG